MQNLRRNGFNWLCQAASRAQSTSISKGRTASDTTINPRLRGVFDPLSALLATSLKPQSASGNPCNHVLPIFTGRARFDLSLHQKPGDDAQKAHDIVVCEADYAAIPGEPFQKIELEITFSKVSKPKFWLVERISLPTDKGTVTIERAATSISGSRQPLLMDQSG